MTQELHRQYRPKTLKGIKGQPKAVALLERLFKANKVPHQIMFTGPSGCGKTTLARIVATKLDCHEKDFKEINCADFKGIDMARGLIRTAHAKPLFGRVRVWLIDEAQMMTKEAQNALLKLFEEPPDWVYIMIATTDPAKILDTIKTRMTEIKVNLLKDEDIRDTIRRVAEKEDLTIHQDAMDKLVDAACGSARQALVILQQLIGIKGEDEQVAAIDAVTAKSEAYQIGTGLLYQGAPWASIASLIKKMEDNNWEGIRMLVLSMATNILLDMTKLKFHPRAYKVMIAFSEPFFNTGKAGLVMSAYEASRPSNPK